MSKMNMQSILKVVVVAGFLTVTSTSYAVEGTWAIKTDMPTARFSLSTSVVNGKIYAIGGGKTPYGAYLSTVEEYDPTTNTWTRKADMPTARSGHAAAVVNGKIYVIGGEPSAQASLSTVEEYDPTTDTWTRKADMPTQRTFLCACALDDKVYVFGGVTAGVPGAAWNPSAVEVYDPATDTWATKGNMPTPRGLAGACAMNGRIYMMGGVIGSTHNAPLPTVDEYDPATDTWTRKANMPTARAFLFSSVVDDKIYAIGGANYGGPVFATVEEYDPTTDTWITKPDMPTRRGMLSTSVVNGKIYAIGGSRNWWPWTGISTVEEYDIGLNVSSTDFNGDGKVDINDLLRLIESWGQDDPMADIAPTFGDGIVDALDLGLLMNYWGQTIDDPTLIAHWPLDETEGIRTREIVSGNDDYALGEVIWGPADGKVGGALLLDGVDDCVVTSFVLDPAGGPFSLLAWVKGGAPGQVIISQVLGSNCLMLDTEGRLMTELKSPGRDGIPLISEAKVDDGQWHRIGLIWDGLYRMLCVDNTIVAEDMQDGLAGSGNGLYIGAGKNIQTGTHFSGLIDDVRIYNRAVSPQ
jgi:N-acetylneuraminic acid mutarotase